MSMNNIRLQFAQEFPYPEIAHSIIIRLDRPAKSVDNDYFVTLPLRLIEKLTLRPKGRPGNKRDIVSPLGQQLAGYECVFLSSTNDQSGYYVNDFQYLIHIKHNP